MYLSGREGITFREQRRKSATCLPHCNLESGRTLGCLSQVLNLFPEEQLAAAPVRSPAGLQSAKLGCHHYPLAFLKHSNVGSVILHRLCTA